MVQNAKDPLSAPGTQQLGLVVIGRNEGERLVRCLESVGDVAAARVYVDSGSRDDSVAIARRAGFDVIVLSAPPAFTAARARNAGIARLLAEHPELAFVQVVDGDCELRARWLQTALATLQAAGDLAAVFGRRRERYPERSLYNAICDDEWNAPVGVASGFGGDVMCRIAALRQVDFYNASMIAGEDTELAMRLRKAGWRIRCLDAEMTLHDADIRRFSQWWSRARRAGHGYAQMAALHPDARDPNWSRSVRSIVLWGGVAPLTCLAAAIGALSIDPRLWALVAVVPAAWLFNVLRLARHQRRRGLDARVARGSAVLLMLGKLPQVLGVAGYYRDRLLGRTSRLIEYKGAQSA